jgi:hypothetical protein
LIFYRGYAPHCDFLPRLCSSYQQLVKAVKRISDTSSDSPFVLFFFHERYIILTSACSYNMFINLSWTWPQLSTARSQKAQPMLFMKHHHSYSCRVKQRYERRTKPNQTRTSLPVPTEQSTHFWFCSQWRGPPRSQRRRFRRQSARTTPTVPRSGATQRSDLPNPQNQPQTFLALQWSSVFGRRNRKLISDSFSEISHDAPHPLFSFIFMHM